MSWKKDQVGFGKRKKILCSFFIFGVMFLLNDYFLAFWDAA
jgi:hypothetical protein